MEDPWGSSPWAAASDTSLPKIDLPAAPQSAHFPADRTNSPRRSVQGVSAWDEGEDAWGGWNDAGSGGNSPAWGRSPGLRPVVSRSRGVSPDPWADARNSLSAGVDSPINVGRGRESVSRPRRVSTLTLGEQDVWLRPPSEERSTTSMSERLADTQVSPKGGPVIPSVEDEDIPKLTRRPSKVQDLVVMYNGIAGRSVSPSLPSPSQMSERKLSSSNGGVGDKEGLPQAMEQSSPHVEAETEAETQEVSEETAADHEHEREEEAKTQIEVLADDQGWHDAQAGEPTSPFEHSEAQAEVTVPEIQPSVELKEPVKAPIEKVDIPYPIDLSHLDALFPSTEAVNVDPEPVPDVIIDDTFAPGSERKAWYLLSRAGSLRMHNMGEDENYVRMDWTHSTVRMDTLKTVRRWLEEDSITGRVVLGRKTGALGANMFNWNSTAPEVDVGVLLGKTSGHRKETSKGSIASLASLASPVAATFGWSSQPSSPVASAAPSLGAPARPQSLIMPPKQTFPRDSIDQALSRPTRPPPQPLTIAKPQESNDGAEDDDDDEWGEMVASPTTGGDNVISITTFAPITTESPLGSPIRIEPPGDQRLSVDASKRQSTQDSGVFSMSKASGSPKMQSPTSPGFGWETTRSPMSEQKETAAAAPPMPGRASLLFEADSPPALPSPSAEEKKKMEQDEKLVVSPPAEMLSRQSTAGSEPPWTPDDEETVQSILRRLPNLSYMLGRD